MRWKDQINYIFIESIVVVHYDDTQVTKCDLLSFN